MLIVLSKEAKEGVMKRLGPIWIVVFSLLLPLLILRWMVQNWRTVFFASLMGVVSIVVLGIFALGYVAQTPEASRGASMLAMFVGTVYFAVSVHVDPYYRRVVAWVVEKLGLPLDVPESTLWD